MSRTAALAPRGGILGALDAWGSWWRKLTSIRAPWGQAVPAQSRGQAASPTFVPYLNESSRDATLNPAPVIVPAITRDDAKAYIHQKDACHLASSRRFARQMMTAPATSLRPMTPAMPANAKVAPIRGVRCT